MMMRARRALALSLAAIALTACATAGARAPATAGSLYQRLGGYDAIAAVIDDFLAREMADARIVPFFKGLEPRELQRVRQHLVDQVCFATGGPCYYPGKDMKAAHAELEITDQVWNVFTGHFNESLQKFKVGTRERNELVAIIGSLRKDIVNKP